MDNLTRRNVRYICFRLKTEAEGGEAVDREGILAFTDEVREHMEEQTGFGGWSKFGVTWDVDEQSYFVVVPLKKSIESAWNTVLKRNAIDLPATEEAAKPVKKRKSRLESWLTK